MLTHIPILFITGLLLAIACQDFKYRAVSWVLFPLLFGTAVWFSLGYVTLKTLSQYAAVNISFLLMQLLTLTLYYTIKNRKLTNITAGLLGWGDILLLFTMAFLMAPPNFLVFYVFSLMVILLGIFFVYLKRKFIVKKIPLAGLQASILIVLLVSIVIANGNPFDDSWILQLF